MSLHITINTPEGIVMASDSRVTEQTYAKNIDGTIGAFSGVSVRDDGVKLYKLYSRIGISVSGTLLVRNVYLPEYMEGFILENRWQSDGEKVAKQLLKECSENCECYETYFHVAGYDIDNTKHVYKVNVKDRTLEEICDPAIYDGEVSVLNAFQHTNEFSAKWQLLYEKLATIDGALHFVKDGIHLTAQYAPLRNGVRTVGGRIDILIIKPDIEYEIQREALEL